MDTSLVCTPPLPPPPTQHAPSLHWCLWVDMLGVGWVGGLHVCGHSRTQRKVFEVQGRQSHTVRQNYMNPAINVEA